MLSKKGHYVDKKSLKSICHSVSDSYLSYASLAWVQNSSSVKGLHILQTKPPRLIFWLVYVIVCILHI